MPTAFDILGLSPFERADGAIVAAFCRAGALGILDLGRDPAAAREALSTLVREVPQGFGVRVPDGVSVDAGELPAAVTHVVLSRPEPEASALRAPALGASPFAGRTVLVQVTSLEEARTAVAHGADGLILKGHESGGRVGEESSFLLLQRVAAEVPVPVWVQGGVGLHTAAACFAGGARGVVLDSQLALLAESRLPEPMRAALHSLDGSETELRGGERVLARPRAPVFPAGQDAAFARPLAERFRTAAGLVQGLREAIAAQLRQAKAHRPLAPGAPLAQEHGLRYPILQGPMTRVSDRASFADAVAREGALPFLALALLRGHELRSVLKDAQEKLAGRTWGVGILGFVPPELREEQLAVLEEFRPPVALIAGGRPSQARALEARGTITYLHVPSPGLLNLFLRDGARHFVFEGRECGGHVGPRTSFVLWEAQLERLLAFEAPEELSVVFAGGIHDARSAAMVAALGAPLAARGAKLGVLMGTAYLFTEEAVASGAIQPGFQEAALACERTVLLETAPGHATRCVDSEYVEAFRAEKERLEASGVGPQDVWAALEQLNLGRLRIASKGIRREGDALVAVAPEEQRREGLYMIGQVATLRRSVVSMAALHGDVSLGATALLGALEIKAPRRAEGPPADVAIVGVACLFPGAADTETFWANVVGAVNAVTEVPRERWNPEIYYDPKAENGQKTNSKWGGFLPEVPFDPLAYGIPPRSLAAIEPVQLLALEVAKRALDDAGYGERQPSGPQLSGRSFDRERASVIFGAQAGTDLAGAYGFRALYPQYVGELPEALDEHLPSLTEDSFPGVLANVIAGRIANRLDLGGVNYTVDAACASSLAAVDLAVKELTSGESDLVVCGGADLHNSINDYLLFSSVHALSPRGRCATFDADADGIVLGEGVAVVVLKRLADAERDGDRIYAVLKGIAGSSDGKSLGLTAPRPEGQARALERAYRRAGISPAEVGLVEAHGTGTVVGDRTELLTLTDVFVRAGALAGSCALGSVKSQIGHTKCAAGMAGLIKAALAIHRRVLPPTLHIRKPNAAWDARRSPFTFADAARPWTSPRRVAAVSAFGFGGTNFHAVLAEPPRDAAPATERRPFGPQLFGVTAWPAELFLFRAGVLERLEALLGRDEPWRLADLARSVCEAGEGPVQVALVAESLADLREKVAAARAGTASPGVFFAGSVGPPGPRSSGEEPGGVAFLFPGQGSQRPGMLRELFVAFPELGRYLSLGVKWHDRLFPPAAFGDAAREEQKAALTDTRVAQPALGVVELALAALLEELGVAPDLLGGHSYGELVALARAGAFDEATLLALSEARGRCIAEAAGAEPGTMAAVAAGGEAVRRALGDLREVVLANENAPEQTVIAGPRAAVDEALERLERAKIAARPLAVACAFHSPVVAAASESFARVLAAATVMAPKLAVWSNAGAEQYPADAAAVRARLAAHVASPVRFRQEIEAMYAAGARTFVEVGPGRVLTGLVRKILRDRPHAAIACDDPSGSGLRALQLALAELAARGVAVETRRLFEGRARAFPLDAAPSLRPAPTAWRVNGHLARPLNGEPPKGALRPVMEPLGLVAAAAPAATGKDAVVLEYLKSLRSMVETQREVMLTYLGQAPAAQPARIVEVAAAALPAPAVTAVVDVKATLLGIVSESTGYPAEMLGMDLDLEADLGVDSIKRIEILGVLSEKIGLGLKGAKDRDALVEELATRKTIRSILEWLEKRMGASTVAPTSTSPSTSMSTSTSTEGISGAVQRYLLSLERAPDASPNGLMLSGRSFALADDGRGVAPALARLLRERGAAARVLGEGEPLGKIDGLIHLTALAPHPPRDVVARAFELLREAVLGGATFIVGATGLGGDFGRRANGHIPTAGIAGLMKSLAKEKPELRVCAVDLDPEGDPSLLAEQICAEILASDRRVEVGYLRGERHVLSPVATRAPASASPLALRPEDVVLVTGGARGITAQVAVALAERFHCVLELVGRSPLPDDEDPALAGAPDAVSLRKKLLDLGERDPTAIEARCARLLRDREIRRTLAALQAAGARTVGYHSVDVRDDDAFGGLVDSLYAQHGRIAGVVHGAGVIEDKLLGQKTAESFRRVFDTKVAGARTLARKLKDDVDFVAFFSSVSGAFGNRGQLDYAAANDAIDKIAWALKNRIRGRVVSINWGPWTGAGMVSPELEREYAKRGVGLISPERGIASFLDELEGGSGAETQVILLGPGSASVS